MSKKMVQTTLICPECGNEFPIMRKINRQKKYFHRKWIYCCICKKETNHIEAKDLDLLLGEIEFTSEENRTEEEQLIYRLVKKE